MSGTYKKSSGVVQWTRVVVRHATTLFLTNMLDLRMMKDAPHDVAVGISVMLMTVLVGVRIRRAISPASLMMTHPHRTVAVVAVVDAMTLQGEAIRAVVAAVLHGLAMALVLHSPNMNNVQYSAASWTRMWLNVTWANFSRSIWDKILC